MFFTIKPRTIVDFGEEVVPAADITTVTDGPQYFSRMYDQELVDDAPVFDHFTLMTTDHTKPETWEWLLQDVHTITGGEIPVTGWFISEHCKQVLEQFSIAPPYRFYPAKLKYQQRKLDYFVFNLLRNDLKQIVVFEELKFNLTDLVTKEVKDQFEGTIHDKKELSKTRLQFKQTQRLDMELTSITLSQRFDFLPLFGINADIVISEPLKQAIERAGIEGVVIKPAPYEIIIL